MNRRSIPYSRRRFLRGLGTCMALPFLESTVPRAAAKAAAGKAPIRMAYVYFPNGVNTEKWAVGKTGKDFELSSTLRPLSDIRDKIQILSGLTLDKARANGDGGGDHARANASFLTGCQARKTSGADVRIGVSVDQIVAEHLRGQTRLSSIELSCDQPRLAGNCDSGYSCSYQYNLSWKTESTPMTPERNPRRVFDRLFTNQIRGEETKSRAIRDRYNKSILDFVLEDAKDLQRHLGRTDRGKLDEYLTTVREIESSIENAEKFTVQRPDYKQPRGIPKKFSDHMRVMYDLMALAFQTDTTRIGTFLLAHDGSTRSFKHLGVPEAHHSLSHHKNDRQKLRKIAKIDRFYVENFAYFLEKLNSMSDGPGGTTLLDNCMVVYGGGISDGNRHSHHDLPVVLAGGGGGTLTPGRHTRFAEETPMTNLYLSMLDRMGVSAERIGDSTGMLESI